MADVARIEEHVHVVIVLARIERRGRVDAAVHRLVAGVARQQVAVVVVVVVLLGKAWAADDVTAQGLCAVEVKEEGLLGQAGGGVVGSHLADQRCAGGMDSGQSSDDRKNYISVQNLLANGYYRFS